MAATIEAIPHFGQIPTAGFRFIEGYDKYEMDLALY
jgi:hypothetical protein